MALTIKQEKFCVEYAKSGNATQAYKNAGYNCKNDNSCGACACELLKNPKIKERLAELAEEVKTAAIADITEMQETLTRIIRQQAEEEVIIVESNGDFTTEARIMNKKAAIREVINAINTLGKMQGAFVEKVDISGSVPVVISGDDGLED